MKAWLVNIAIVSIFSAIADMILPDAHISRYAKLCSSLLLTTVIISPMITYDKTGVSLSIPEFADYSIEESTDLIDKEFSTRLTDVVRSDTSFNNITIKANLNYDSIDHIYIHGAKQWQIDNINNILLTKYNIPVEIITYESVEQN